MSKLAVWLGGFALLAVGAGLGAWWSQWSSAERPVVAAPAATHESQSIEGANAAAVAAGTSTLLPSLDQHEEPPADEPTVDQHEEPPADEPTVDQQATGAQVNDFMETQIAPLVHDCFGQIPPGQVTFAFRFERSAQGKWAPAAGDTGVSIQSSDLSQENERTVLGCMRQAAVGTTMPIHPSQTGPTLELSLAWSFSAPPPT
ncbi:MAG: hypothetical protein EXR73_07900 [Myxococcales bacterium]|nr:hypothetical protein [Myxococcales bacterium]